MLKPDHSLDLVSDIDYAITDAEPELADSARLEEIVDPDYEVGADPDYDDTVQADYEPAADPDYDEPVAEPEATPEIISVMAASAAGFAFEVGRTVLPRTQAQAHPVVWRGHLKERHPATGLVHRVPVYRLADGYWDCYREEELQVA